MSFLADTHAVIWYLQGAKQLSLRARAIFEDPAALVAVSAVST